MRNRVKRHLVQFHYGILELHGQVQIELTNKKAGLESPAILIRAKARQNLEPIVSERLVGVGHSVGVFLLLDR